jgi:anti-sigma regulatory factor (Ser/Thr protein kinase)
MHWSSSLDGFTQRLVRIEAPADVGEARRQAHDAGRQLGLGDAPSGRLALAVTEAGSNIVKHARAGTMLIRALPHESAPAIEVLALDNGPGMTDVSLSMQDGYSTAGTPGTGLGALSRVTQALDIYTRTGLGTALRFEVGDGSREDRNEPLDVGAVCVAKPGESACGDAWAFARDADRGVVLVVDGLGHGPEAASAAHAALDALRHGLPAHSSLDALTAIHHALRGTRGAAGSIAVLDLPQHHGSYCGIGNIVGATRMPAATRQLVSYNGILGHQTRTMHAVGFDFPDDALFIAHSDGINTHWRLDAYPGLERHHPALVAGVLFRDHARGRDDATCVVLRRAQRKRART